MFHFTPPIDKCINCRYLCFPQQTRLSSEQSLILAECHLSEGMMTMGTWKKPSNSDPIRWTEFHLLLL